MISYPTCTRFFEWYLAYVQSSGTDIWINNHKITHQSKFQRILCLVIIVTEGQNSCPTSSLADYCTKVNMCTSWKFSSFLVFIFHCESIQTFAPLLGALVQQWQTELNSSFITSLAFASLFSCTTNSFGWSQVI